MAVTNCTEACGWLLTHAYGLTVDLDYVIFLVIRVSPPLQKTLLDSQRAPTKHIVLSFSKFLGKARSLSYKKEVFMWELRRGSEVRVSPS